MEVTRFADLCPRTVWGLVDDAFDLYRERFTLLASSAALAYIPLYVLYLFLANAPTREIYRNQNNTENISSLLAPLLVMLLLTPLLGIATILQGAAAAVVTQGQLRGELPTVQQVMARVGRKIVPLLVSAFLVGLWYAAATLFTCGLGVLWPMVVAAFVSQAIVLENRGIGEAFRRSGALVKGYGWRTLGLLLLVYTLLYILILGVAGLMAGIAELVPTAQGKSGLDQEMAQEMLSSVMQAICTLLISPLIGVAQTLLYYDHRVRREGLDFECQAEEQGVTLAPDYFGGIGTEWRR